MSSSVNIQTKKRREPDASEWEAPSIDGWKPGTASRKLMHQVYRRLDGDGFAASVVRAVDLSKIVPSVVLFLLSPTGDRLSVYCEPSLVLTKRSQRVRQPGDLCCPGGGIASRTDRLLGRFLKLPGSPLTRWSSWEGLHRRHPGAAGRLSTFLAAGLREGWEEMRLNPMGVRFMGVLPPQELVMFRRVILPLVGWLPRQKRFVPNWEVERPVSIPLRLLLDPDNYACYRLSFQPPRDGVQDRETLDFPCFVHRLSDTEEILWGATFRIVMSFLDRVFGFSPPSVDTLPVIHDRLSRNYTTGNG